MDHQPLSNSSIESSEIQLLRQQIVDQIDGRIADVLNSLPQEYFEQLRETERLEHFKALVALKVCDVDQEIMLRQQDGSRVTIISTQNYPGQLARMMHELPDEFPLIGAKIFTSADEDFIVDVFDYKIEDSRSLQEADEDGGNRDEIVAEVMELTGATEPEVCQFIERFHCDHEILSSSEEIASQFIALRETEHINDIKVLYRLRSASVPGGKQLAKITISAASSTTREIVQRAATYLGHCEYDIRRAFCENIVVGDTVEVALLTFHVVFEEASRTFLSKQERYRDFDDLGDLVCREMEMFLRIDGEVIESSSSSGVSIIEEFGGLEKAEVFCGLAKLTQHKLNFKSDLELPHERITRALLKQKSLVSESLDFFIGRFCPQGSRSGGLTLSDDSIRETLEAINDSTDRAIVGAFVELVSEIQRCNFAVERRRVLAFRMPGSVFENLNRGETPFAVFYVFGSGFDGVHVRFRDVARGGMRLVPTRNQEHYLYNSLRVFEEAWRLASAQQLKNKDIAEGGAKAVVVIKPGVDHQKAGRDFVDGLLDLVTELELTNAVDQPATEDEYLYLGPDENVSDALIEWVVERSRERHYAFPSTIMSSKPLSGINHKKYGVTSEGVLVFLRYALIENGIDPDHDAFTIKLTGGPDGDVGGNAIRILIRDYADKVAIVGISDGTGSAVDPKGLNQEALLVLVEQGLGIHCFPPDLLSADGFVSGLKEESEIARRNNMHNEVTADVFLPAGGRPSTINATNWRDFLNSRGEPSSAIIVEGANLFITDEARDYLGQSGVSIVKDSSANKCGVICSSLEIIAAMLLSEPEFLSIKSVYVEEVLKLLRQLAGTEALGLFNERLRQPEVDLPRISIMISQQMIRLADMINDGFERWLPEEQAIANEFVTTYLPPSLVSFFEDSVIERIPPIYRRHLVAAILSSRIVYREGCQSLGSMHDSDLEQLIRSQLYYEKQVRVMIAQLEQSELPNKGEMIRILDFAGARGQRDLRMPKMVGDPKR